MHVAICVYIETALIPNLNKVFETSKYCFCIRDTGPIFISLAQSHKFQVLVPFTKTEQAQKSILNISLLRDKITIDDFHLSLVIWINVVFNDSGIILIHKLNIISFEMRLEWITLTPFNSDICPIIMAGCQFRVPVEKRKKRKGKFAQITHKRTSQFVVEAKKSHSLNEVLKLYNQNSLAKIALIGCYSKLKR